jgi:SAM-dependent methyltransferase
LSVPPRRRVSFAALTESAGLPVTDEGYAMIGARYAYAARLARARRVLEIACGSGIGLGVIAGRARFVVGADLDAELLASAGRHYRSRVPLVRLSAESLPFATGSFDLVLLYEASYYVPDLERAFDEMARVLGPGGQLVVVTANPERADFIRSPHSHRYYSADELRSALERRGLEAAIEGAYPVSEDGGGRSWTSVVRRVLEGLHLIPRTLRGRALLKRLVNRSLVRLPAEIPATGAVEAARAAIPAGPASGYKVLYATGTRLRPESGA